MEVLAWEGRGKQEWEWKLASPSYESQAAIWIKTSWLSHHLPNLV